MLKLVALGVLFTALSASARAATAAPEPVGALPSPRQLAWQQLEYYAFVHFNMNTFTNMEWGEGEETPAQFNPTELDCRQWARVCRDAGMKGIIITAKHHDGFCLWPSKYTEHSVKNSPWRDGKGDLLRELSDACREFGLKFGVYMSPWDRHEPSYGDSPRYNEHFMNQLREALTDYGDVFEVWFDGACGEGPNGKRQEYDWPAFIAVVRECQPDAVIFSDGGPDIRWVGNEQGFANPTNWSLLDRDEFYPGCPRHRELTSGHRNGTHWLPAECDVSIRPGWYYHADQDDQVKSLEKLVDIYFHSVGRNGSLLLNLPVDRRGLVHENDVARLQELRRYLDAASADNLAAGKTASADNARGGDARFAPANALDGRKDTYWATDDGVIEATLEVDLGAPATFSVFQVEEPITLGQRVEAFAVEALVDGAWQRLAEETTIGNKRLLRFPAVTASKVRLAIHEAKACPCIANVAVYLAPPRVAIAPEAPAFFDAVDVTLESDVPGAVIHYTLDGAEPDEKAPQYAGPIPLTETATVRARAYFGGKQTVVAAEKAFTRYASADLKPAEEGGATEAGLEYTYYEGGWQSLQDMDKATAVAEGTAPGCDLSVRQRDTHFALKFEGFVRVPADGLYTFYTRSDDGSRLYVHGALIVDNDGLHGMVERSGQVPLRAGLHPIAVTYFNATGGLGLEVAYEGPGLPKQAIPADAFQRPAARQPAQ
ncbi:MAG: alpha-L-fucosidase [Candidatus Hydrogenedentes bacterium]|nr:alpha-L-fucosidase [Candidatus Hydrogenedentota bacterium]